MTGKFFHILEDLWFLRFSRWTRKYFPCPEGLNFTTFFNIREYFSCNGILSCTGNIEFERKKILVPGFLPLLETLRWTKKVPVRKVPPGAGDFEFEQTFSCSLI